MDVDDNALLASLQRHINCLADPERGKRKNSLVQLTKELLGSSPPSEDDLRVVFNHIYKPLLKLFEDSMEKCRELSIDMMTQFADKLEVATFGDSLPFVIPMIRRRIGMHPVAEDVEEIRLQLMELMLKCITIAGPSSADYMDDLVAVLEKTIVDAFPDAKKVACQVVSRLAAVASKQVGMHSETILKYLKANLTHQHSKVRSSSLEAMGDIVPCGSVEVLNELPAAIKPLSQDRAGTVRESLYKIVGSWLKTLPDKEAYDAKLLPILIHGLCDDIPANSALCTALFDELGAIYEEERKEELKEITEYHIDGNCATDDRHGLSSVTPEVFKSRPRIGQRMLVRNKLSKMIPELVVDMVDWTAPTRLQASKAAAAIVVHAEEFITQHLEPLFSALYKTAVDDERDVASESERCAQLIGHYCEPPILFELLLPQVKGSFNTSPSHRTGAMLVLSNVLRGIQVSRWSEGSIATLIQNLSQPEIAHYEHTDFQNRLFEAIMNAVTSAGERCKPFSRPIFVMLLQLQSVEENQTIKRAAVSQMPVVASVLGYDAVEGLYKAHFGDILKALSAQHTGWTRHSPGRHLFETLLETSGEVVAEHVQDIMPVLAHLMHPEKDGDMRNNLFVLLCKLLSNPLIAKAFGDHCEVMVQQIVIPNATWKIGRIAVAIRQSAMTVLGVLLKTGLVPQDTLRKLFSELMPVIKSNLEDDASAALRLTVAVYMKYLLQSLGTLDAGEKEVHEFWPELLRRLDDSDDQVRIAICHTLVVLTNVMKNGASWAAEHIFKSMLLHLDDNNEEMKDAVFAALEQMMHFDKDVFITEATKASQRHRDKARAEKLLAIARQ